MEIAPQEGMQRGKIGGSDFRFRIHERHSG
jgi:hypothetical protein